MNMNKNISLIKQSMIQDKIEMKVEYITIIYINDSDK
jgi:hypothetical protein